MFLIRSKYRFFPLVKVAPKGSKTPIFIFVSFAIVSTMSGLNCGSESTHVTFSCSITSLISASCSAPGKTSVFTVNAPIIFTVSYTHLTLPTKRIV